MKLEIALLIFIVGFIYPTESYSQPYTSKTVDMGGGGFITGIITSKTEANLMYCRTDVGGAYRWDATTSTWVPLLDWNSDQQTSYQGVEALALDPQVSSNLYMLVGTSYWNGDKTAILKSTDYGNTFTITDVTSQFTATGNGMGRQNGERLVVDPNNSNILFCGTRANGLWKSTNGGATWSLAWNGVTTTTNGNGICFVLFDPSSVSGGVTQTIYVGVSRTGTTTATANFYKSTDGGATFTAVSGRPTSYMPQRAVLASDKNMYITYADAEGPWNPTAGQVWKYNTTTGTWTNITPAGYTSSTPFGGVSVDPGNASRVIVSTINKYLTQYTSLSGTTIYGDYVFLSTDGGTSWTNVITKGTGMTLNTNGIPWIDGNSIHWAGSVEFDPFSTNKVWVASGDGIFSCSDVTASQTTWTFNVKGIEETVPQDMISITGGGPLMSAILDYDGFRSPSVTTYYDNYTPQVGNNTGVAYASLSTSKVVRVCTSSKMYYSTDQGVTWTQCATMNGSQGKVAVSADGSTILHCPGGASTTYRSTNNGGSWTSTGVTNITDAFPVADQVNTNKFYMYNPSSGAMMVSTNAGVSFSTGGSPGTGGSKVIRTAPGLEGHIWVALYSSGLKYSTNSGTSFTTVSNVTYCAAVGLGKIVGTSTYPAVYIWGTVGGVTGVFGSTDQGATWTRINTDAQQFGGPGNAQMILGDLNIAGRVYMSTAGRGIVYWDTNNSLPVTLVSFTGTLNGSNTVNLNWTVAGENNLKGYKILRSTDTNQQNPWEYNGFIYATNNGSNYKEYSFNDLNPPTVGSSIFYKLILVNNDDSYSMSRTIVVDVKKEDLFLQVSPNPSGSDFTVKTNGEDGVLQLFTVNGKLIMEMNVSSLKPIFYIGESLASGMYFLIYKNGTEQKSVKLIKE